MAAHPSAAAVALCPLHHGGAGGAVTCLVRSSMAAGDVGQIQHPRLGRLGLAPWGPRQGSSAVRKLLFRGVEEAR